VAHHGRYDNSNRSATITTEMLWEHNRRPFRDWAMHGIAPTRRQFSRKHYREGSRSTIGSKNTNQGCPCRGENRGTLRKSTQDTVPSNQYRLAWLLEGSGVDLVAIEDLTYSGDIQWTLQRWLIRYHPHTSTIQSGQNLRGCGWCWQLPLVVH